MEHQEVEFLRGKVNELTRENEHLKSALGIAKEYISHFNGDLKNVVLREVEQREKGLSPQQA